ALASRDPTLIKPWPPRIVVTLIRAPTDVIANLNPNLKLPVPPRSPFACDHAPADATPETPASVAITQPPKEGTYLYKNEGTVEIKGAIPLKLPYPPVSQMIVRDVKQETIKQLYFGNVHTTTFVVEQPITPTLK